MTDPLRCGPAPVRGLGGSVRPRADGREGSGGRCGGERTPLPTTPQPLRLHRPLAIDISSEPAVEAGFAELAEAGWSPDVVVANAGVQLFGQDAKIADLDLAVWQRTVDVNLTGTMLTVKHAVRSMLTTGGGSIILTGSPTGLTGEGNDFTSYATTKAGIHGLARTVAAAYAADGIRVNAVVPGYTETPLVTTISDDPAERAAIVGRIPMGRPGTPADVEGIMVFLASDDAAFATGALFRVDGGMTSL
ncbi:SDR family NAD(P)-dependent oxidoreductase [Brachybacterium atlanticum]|uniref:SDR family NAD(P)-dependent oxidoreductase n=1 Tax=Brachybacterium atlanticum TaxID=2911888 RepID=UPI0021E0CB2C|nr:SDR family oxidoreductase [Brachybacterium atlanticum]